MTGQSETIEWVQLNRGVRSSDGRYLIEDNGSRWATERFWLFDSKLVRTVRFRTMPEAKSFASAPR